MSEVNPLFRAHMLLFRWGCEALAEATAEGDTGSEAGTPSAARDGSGADNADSHLQHSTRQQASQQIATDRAIGINVERPEAIEGSARIRTELSGPTKTTAGTISSLCSRSSKC